ncbi:MAG: hypothetical protein ABL959_18535, partial [Pyrinomonadaceae bacterium]
LRRVGDEIGQIIYINASRTHVVIAGNAGDPPATAEALRKPYILQCPHAPRRRNRRLQPRAATFPAEH